MVLVDPCDKSLPALETYKGISTWSVWFMYSWIVPERSLRIGYEKKDLCFALTLSLILNPPVVVVDQQDVDGDGGVDEEGKGEEKDKQSVTIFPYNFTNRNNLIPKNAKEPFSKNIWSWKKPRPW